VPTLSSITTVQFALNTQLTAGAPTSTTVRAAQRQSAPAKVARQGSAGGRNCRAVRFAIFLSFVLIAMLL
jgi:hypothetical protein